MFKIQNQFWIDILEKRKTLEFRKVNFLKKITYIDKYIFLGNGRFYQKVIDNENSKTLGTITFNGYKIIDKEYLFILIDNCETRPNDFFMRDSLKDYLGLEQQWQISWVLNNYEFLKEYYKNETEILLIYIESFEVIKNG